MTPLEAATLPALSPSSQSVFSTIEQIWSDGTVFLANGMSLRLPAKALKHPDVKVKQSILVYSANGRYSKDKKGRVAGWLLVLDQEAEILPGFIASDVREAQLPAGVLDRAVEAAEPGFAAGFRDMNLLARATVAPPVGQVLEQLAAARPAVSPGATVYLMNDREVRLGKNVLREEFVRPGAALVFGASPVHKTKKLIRALT
ncbi:MAG: hypothetical protein HY714_00145 [Candidatus Omnitrophica bacterium]|nr:hypothetical protein [Candidatus Omnitrophota bacterium]